MAYLDAGTVLIGIANGVMVIALCVALYLLWKRRR